jgi:hypothetical protein
MSECQNVRMSDVGLSGSPLSLPQTVGSMVVAYVREGVFISAGPEART